MTSPITIEESKRFIQLEKIIERGRLTFVEVGDALLQIRDSKLYRSDYSTFEDYCRERWGWNRRYCNRLIEASSVIQKMGPIGPKVAAESQARELARVEPEKRAQVLETASSNGDLTAKRIREAAAKINGAAQERPNPEMEARLQNDIAKCVALEAHSQACDSRRQLWEQKYESALRIEGLIRSIRVTLQGAKATGTWLDFPDGDRKIQKQLNSLVEYCNHELS